MSETKIRMTTLQLLLVLLLQNVISSIHIEGVLVGVGVVEFSIFMCAFLFWMPCQTVTMLGLVQLRLTTRAITRACLSHFVLC